MTHMQHNNHLFVTVPEGAKYIHVDKYEHSLSYATREGWRSIGLPLLPGHWQPVGLASELSEEQCADIVEAYVYSGRISFQAFKNYIKPIAESMDDIFANPSESFDSLLRSHNLKANQTVILKLIEA